MTAGETGARGEAIAEDYLKQKGYCILAKNFRTRFGEIDIVAEEEGYLAFVEVKTRKNQKFSAAREAVSFRKQQKIIAAAQSWLQQNPTAAQPRFDVIEVYMDGSGLEQNPKTIHLQNAFEAGGPG